MYPQKDDGCEAIGMNEQDFYTLEDVSRLLSVPVSTVIQWTRQGLPYMVKGNRWVFVKENVVEWAGEPRHRRRSRTR